MLWGLVFGSAGIGYFMYGKRQKRMMPYICGLGLMVFPYFITNTLILVGAGLILLALPYFIRV
jgi:hypothetical protein